MHCIISGNEDLLRVFDESRKAKDEFIFSYLFISHRIPCCETNKFFEAPREIGFFRNMKRRA